MLKRDIEPCLFFPSMAAKRFHTASPCCMKGIMQQNHSPFTTSDLKHALKGIGFVWLSAGTCETLQNCFNAAGVTLFRH